MTFKIATKNGTEEVKGEAVKIAGRRCFISEDEVRIFSVTHAETGTRICYDLTREAAIEKAKKAFNENDFAKKINSAIAQLKFNGIEYPVNP